MTFQWLKSRDEAMTIALPVIYHGERMLAAVVAAACEHDRQIARANALQGADARATHGAALSISSLTAIAETIEHSLLILRSGPVQDSPTGAFGTKPWSETVSAHRREIDRAISTMIG